MGIVWRQVVYAAVTGRGATQAFYGIETELRNTVVSLSLKPFNNKRFITNILG